MNYSYLDILFPNI